MSKYLFYVDMDGCSCNFSKGLELIGSSIEELDTTREVSVEKIKKAGVHFWATLPKMKDWDILWNYINKYDPTFLSAPMPEVWDACIAGKRYWIDHNVGDYQSIFIEKKRKQEYASPKSILIDDHPGNIKRWIEAGGIGIHHPFDSKVTIERLKAIGL